MYCITFKKSSNHEEIVIAKGIKCILYIPSIIDSEFCSFALSYYAMSKQKPTIPKGTRDFPPEMMVKRNFILDTIRQVFQKFGFQPIETPSMEKLSVLTGKYGDEGEQLLFKVLNNGDFLSKAPQSALDGGAKKLSAYIAEKGLRYDLTVPLARFVVMNQNDIALPFRRYQMQPVWRADRPQKGRYREFFQCDADVVGTDSLLVEMEIILLLKEVLNRLGIVEFEIKINHRKVLEGICEAIGKAGEMNALATAIDKLDKIGTNQVMEELANKGFEPQSLEKLQTILEISGSNDEVVTGVSKELNKSAAGLQGIADIKEILTLLDEIENGTDKVSFDHSLARGLSYYTGTVFEVKVTNVDIGSISGGGRYDDLTTMFGMPNTPAVGISLGVDRIYDVLTELNLFPSSVLEASRLLIVNFEDSLRHVLPILVRIREAGISCELYPDSAKLKKQFSYANKKNIPFVLIVGEEEINSGSYTLKDMHTGDQRNVTLEQLISALNQ